LISHRKQRVLGKIFVVPGVLKAARCDRVNQGGEGPGRNSQPLSGASEPSSEMEEAVSGATT